MDLGKLGIVPRRILIVTFIGYAAIWTALLLVPNVSSIIFIPSDLPEELSQSDLPVDKFVHATGYFLLTVMAALAFAAGYTMSRFWWLAAGAALHGALTEVAQLYIPNRSGDILDWAADVTGVCVAAVCWQLLRRLNAPRVGPTRELLE